MAEIRERNIGQVKCIKDGVNQLLVKDEESKHRWQEYFNKLFNGENESSTIELDDSFDETSMFCAANPGVGGEGGFKKDERRQGDGP